MNGNEITNCVYIGYDRNGLFKIGMTKNWRKRIKQIQNMNPAFLFVCVIPCDNPRDVEKEIHDKLYNQRVVGEWFRLSQDDLQALINEYQGVDVPIEDIEMHWEEWIGQDIL